VIRGDISNESPTRWMVTLDCLLEAGYGIPKKGLFGSWENVARNTAFNPLALGRLWRAANRYGLRFEMVIFDQPHDYCEALEANLERLGVHPIVWVNGYKNRPALASALAYRPDVKAVVDENSKALTWGSRGLRIEDL
jgi:hypothetical protein